MIAPRFVSSLIQHPLPFLTLGAPVIYTIMEYRQLEIALLAKCIPPRKDNKMPRVDVQSDFLDRE